MDNFNSDVSKALYDAKNVGKGPDLSALPLVSAGAASPSTQDNSFCLKAQLNRTELDRIDLN